MSRTAKKIETTGLPCEAQNGETIQVVPKIDVTMFGKFTLKQEGMEVPHAVSLTGRSRRLWTLTAYLILHRDRGVSAQELIDLLWPEAENDNPLSTLQNNVSRARAALAELGFTHAKVIIHNEKGYYRWAPDRETQLDVEQFETLAKVALAEEDMEKSVALAQEAVALYTGDFLTESAAEFWCINLNTYYRSLYTRLCRAAVDRLLKLGRITDAEKLCTGVIRLDPAAEEFSVFLMQALIQNKNPKKALEHYDYIASLYREVYGVSPSAELEAQKTLAVQELYGSETSEDDIQTFLLEKEQETGAFCCDNNVFREIVNLHVRDAPKRYPCGVDDCAACKPLGRPGKARRIYEADGSDAFKYIARGRPVHKGGRKSVLGAAAGCDRRKRRARFPPCVQSVPKGIPEKRCGLHL